MFLVYELWAWAPGPRGRARDPRSLGFGPRVQTIQPMCTPNVCADMLRRILCRILCRILGAPNFAPNFCAEFCLQKMFILLGKIAFLKNWARPKFGTQIRRKIRHTQNSAHTSAQNSAHRKFGATFRGTHLAHTLVGSFVLGARIPRIWDPCGPEGQEPRLRVHK